MQTHVVLGRDADCSASPVAPVVATAMNAPADDSGVATAAARAYPEDPGRECVPISTAVCVVAQAAPDDDANDGGDPEPCVDAPTARPVLTARPC